MKQRMRRAVFPRLLTLREAKLAFGGEGMLGGFIHPRDVRRPGDSFTDAIARARAEEDRLERETIVARPTDAPIFICGDFEPEEACSAPGCIYFAEVLCDWPTSRGRTCDLPLCPGHAHPIGVDRDLCPLHILAYQRIVPALRDRRPANDR